MRFPLYSTYNDVKTNWVKFTPIEGYGSGAGPGESIMLPATQGISIDDSASYNQVQLGKIGTALDLAMKSASGGTDSERAASIASGASNALSQMNNTDSILRAAFTAGSHFAPNDTIKQWSALNAKQVISPNTNTLFSGVGVRAFAFSFTLVASNAPESAAIKQIVEHLRQNLYPDAAGEKGFYLKFPPTWEIDFYYGSGSAGGTSKNEYLPKIHRCFLQSLNTTYNSTANSFHDQGAPFDVSVNVSFTETKTYTKSTVLG